MRLSVVRDITERKNGEEALRQAGAYNRSLIEASMDPLVTIDVAGKITDVNAATVSVTGCAREALIGSDFSDYFTEPDRAREGYRRVFQEGLVRDYPLEMRHRDGQMTPVLYNASLYRDKSGAALGVFAAARDITERKRAEQQIERLAAIVRSSNDAIIGKTLEGVVTSWNKGAEDIYGYAEGEIVGKSVSLLVPPDLQDDVVHILRTIKDGGHVEHYETVRQRKDGQLIHVSLTVSPVLDAAGAVTGASTIARDISERIQAEEKLKEHVSELQRWYDSTLNREDRVQELKREVNQLLARLGEPPRYTSQE